MHSTFLIFDSKQLTFQKQWLDSSSLTKPKQAREIKVDMTFYQGQ